MADTGPLPEKGGESMLDEACRILELPNELIYAMGLYISLSDIPAWCLTCRRFYGNIDPATIYKKKCLAMWPHLFALQHNPFFSIPSNADSYDSSLLPLSLSSSGPTSSIPLTWQQRYALLQSHPARLRSPSDEQQQQRRKRSRIRWFSSESDSSSDDENDIVVPLIAPPRYDRSASFFDNITLNEEKDGEGERGDEQQKDGEKTGDTLMRTTLDSPTTTADTTSTLLPTVSQNLPEVGPLGLFPGRSRSTSDPALNAPWWRLNDAVPPPPLEYSSSDDEDNTLTTPSTTTHNTHNNDQGQTVLLEADTKATITTTTTPTEGGEGGEGVVSEEGREPQPPPVDPWYAFGTSSTVSLTTPSTESDIRILQIPQLPQQPLPATPDDDEERQMLDFLSYMRSRSVRPQKPKLEKKEKFEEEVKAEVDPTGRYHTNIGGYGNIIATTPFLTSNLKLLQQIAPSVDVSNLLFKGLEYFEIKLIRNTVAWNRATCVAVSEFFEDGNISFLGWNSSTVAYHSDDGTIQGQGERTPVTMPVFTTNDVVGCGIDWERKFVFFTKNGEFTGGGKKNIKVDREWFPAVGTMCKDDVVYVNFGQEPFVFNLRDYLDHVPSVPEPQKCSKDILESAVIED